MLSLKDEFFLCLDVFAAMFSHRDTAEDKTNRVEITDVDEESLEQLLKFIYTDRIDEANLTTLACGLLTAADKYNVQRHEEILFLSIYTW